MKNSRNKRGAVMTNADIRLSAMQQSAIDLNCEAADFAGHENKVVISKLNAGRKKYIKNPFFCQFECYGNAVVASVNDKIKGFIENFVKNRTGFRCFEQYGELSQEFIKYNKQIHTAEYYLPDINKSRAVNPDFDVKIYIEDEIRQFYGDDRFHMALGYCDEKSERRDVIAVVGYSHLNGEIMGIAGASNDGEKMWQVGIDVVPEFRNKEVATTLVSIITDEILKKGIIPFYGTAWSNIASKNVAIKSGYKSAWVGLAAFDID